LGVITVASGTRRVRTASMASSRSRGAPPLAIITGSSTIGTPGCACSTSATAWAISAVAIMPIFTASTRMSSKIAASCCCTNAGGTRCTPDTPRVFWAVSAVMAAMP